MTAPTEASTASPASASRRDRFVAWIRSHRLLSAGIAAAAAIVIAGATVGGITINAQIRHDQAVAAAEQQLEDLRAAEQQLESSTAALTTATADAIAYRDAVTAATTGNDAYLGATAGTLTSKVEELTELIAAAATETSTADDVTLLVNYDEDPARRSNRPTAAERPRVMQLTRGRFSGRGPFPPIRRNAALDALPSPPGYPL